MTDKEALKLVMDALDDLLYWDNGKPEYDEARKALQVGKQALAQPEQEPVAWMDADGNVSDNNDHKCFPIPLYTHPPQRTEERSGWRKKQIDDAEEEAWRELEKKNEST